MRFHFIDAEKACYPVRLLCRCLAVSRSGYYAWRDRSPCTRSRDDTRLKVKIAASHAASRRTYGSPRIQRDLRDAGDDSRIGLALQGPVSRAVLQDMAQNARQRTMLGHLVTNRFTNVTLAGLPAMVARTGYTGESLGFEVYVHPDGAETFWNAVLEVGADRGVMPAGLGARDSTRLEAGFPLFGHDLEGDLGICITEAGYGYVPRMHVPFFIGRKPLMQRIKEQGRRLLRLQGQGRKTLRAGHVVLDKSNVAVGEITSFAYVHEDMTFVVLACVDARFAPQPGQAVRGVRVAADRFSGDVEERAVVDLTGLTRFPHGDERSAWPERYA